MKDVFWFVNICYHSVSVILPTGDWGCHCECKLISESDPDKDPVDPVGVKDQCLTCQQKAGVNR